MSDDERESSLQMAERADSGDRQAATDSDFGTLFLDLDLRIEHFTEPVTDILKLAPESEGQPLARFAAEIEWANLVDDARTVLARLSPVKRDVRRRDGRWFEVRMRPYRRRSALQGVLVNFIDVTERHQAEVSLRERERQLQRQKHLIDLSHDPIFVWEFGGGIVEWNKGCEDLYGFSAEEAVGKSKAELLQTGVPGGSFEAVKEELLRRGTWSGELQHLTKSGSPVTVESRLQMERMDGSHLVLESTRDVTDRKAWDRRQRLLLRELTHRVKNTLAVVQSIANQTLRHSRTREDFVERFSARLAALATAHSLLVQSDWTGADFEELARAQLDPYTTENPERLHMEGPMLGLPAELATPFGLVLHELAANAAKYGALSRDEGRVVLQWTVVPRDGEKVLSVVWREEGGPQLRRAVKPGFGSMLIDQGVPGAKVAREFTKEGFVCTIDLPLREPRPPAHTT